MKYQQGLARIMTTMRYIKIGFLITILSLLVNFTKAQCTPNFDDTTSVCGVVQFTNLSTPSNSTVLYSWNFGNSSTSTLTSPSATYTANGTYTVCLFMFSSVPSCSANICKTITVNCFSTACTANFSVTNCLNGGQISFINSSPGTNSTTVYDWNFGNSTSSIQQNPTATYTANGIYTVCLSYTTSAPAFCTASICQTVAVNCVSTSCNADFNLSNCVSGQASFSNTSTGTNSTTVYSWNFGNSSTSSQQNPTATYTANGIYTVCLSYTNASPTCSATICKTVNINCVLSPTCQANFTNTPCNNGQMTFFSTSTGTNGSTAYTWSNTPAPSGPPAPYTATVCLTMVNSLPTCSSSVCKTIYVDCVVGVAEFIFENTSVRVFPNPSNGLFNLDLTQSNLNSSSMYVKVYNVIGELVHQSIQEVHQSGAPQQIDLQSLPNGAYYLRLNTGNNSFSVKFIIAK